MTINQRIKKIRESLCEDSNQGFADRLGVSKQAANNYIRDNYNIGRSVIAQILKSFPEINESWLLNGNGSMLKESYKPTETAYETIPLLPIAAQGGTLDEFTVQIKNDGDDLERIVSPIKGADFAITVSGNSMEPEYPSGAKILIKKINEKAFIEWGKVFVLDTVNGVVLKQVKPSGNENCLKCISINKEYDPFEVSMDDVNGMYRVLMVMSLK